MGEAAKILVVEDEKDLRNLLALFLTSQGYDVMTAGNGLEALQVLEKQFPALILLDLMMPVMNGWQFCEKLRSNPALAALPIVVISGVSPKTQPLNKCHVVDFLSKPFEFARLIRAVETYCPRA